MDTSKEYIEMCEAAQEVQLQHEFLSKGDVYIVPPSSDYEIWDVSHPWRKQQGEIWLPRQDQLQQLVWGWIDELEIGLNGKLIEFATYNLKDSADTFEQMWLKIYMREKQNKVWDAEEKVWMDRG